MDMKVILVASALIVTLLQGGCSATASASTGEPQPVINTQECYDHASAVVSPAWASMNKVQRTALFFQIANQCEGK